MTNLFNKIEKDKWTKDIKDYEYKKKNLEWGSNPKPEIITQKLVKESENSYHPILQRYKDKQYENVVKKSEKESMIINLAKTKDNQMRVEQTYDLINLQDKLKDFKEDSNYPRIKPQRIRENVEGTNVNYNIISNKKFSKHHFDRPEKRPNTSVDVK